MMYYGYESRAELQDFVRGTLLGFHPTSGAVRIIQPFDQFAGWVKESQDLTNEPASELSHDTQESTIIVNNGLIPLEAASGVTPITGQPVYAFSSTEFTHDSGAGSYIGRVMKPKFENPNHWEVDTWLAFTSLSPGVAYPEISLGAEAGDVILASVQVQDASGVAVADQVSLELVLLDSDAILELEAAFRLSDGGAGDLITSTDQARLLLTTDVTGLAEVNVTDVAGATGATIYLRVSVFGNAGLARYHGQSNFIAVTFD